MSFDSAFFIACFLPVTALLYALLRRRRGRNWLLLIAGLVFYSFGSLGGLLLLLAAAAVNYGFGLLLSGGARRRRLIAGAAVGLDLAFLACFKYLDFLLSWLPRAWEGPGLAAPVGISFFTFKCVSYILDVYRDRSCGTRSFFRLLLYISFFPQIMAGPITRFPDFAPQAEERQETLQEAAAGLRRFVIGLGKKLILSGAAARVADAVFALGPGTLDARLAWLGAASYSLQIYLDFSGYSDMAIGLGRLFGFRTPENFNYPYIAASVTDFWRRWHISLSAWFRDYLYIPLGGSRKGAARAALNKLVVFTLCGLWHGAAWTFVLWGLWHGVFSALESLGPVRAALKKPAGRVLGHAYALLVACLGFVMFRAASPGEGWQMLRAMFGAFPASAASDTALRGALSGVNLGLLALGAAAATPLLRPLGARLAGGGLRWASYGLCLGLLALCLAELAAGGFAPFIYFQF